MSAEPGLQESVGVSTGNRSGRIVRSVPIRWRILAIAVLNSAVALVLLFVIWNGSQVLATAWQDLRRLQGSERFLNALGAEAERLQGLIHRYFASDDPKTLARIVDVRESLVSRLRVQARLDPILSEPTRELSEITDRLVSGFEDLRDTRTEMARLYQTKVLKPSQEMAGLYAIVNGSSADPASLLWPALEKSREAYNQMVLAANAAYLSGSDASFREAQSSAAAIQRTAPVLQDLARDPVQRQAIDQLRTRAVIVVGGLGELNNYFQTHSKLLREVVDGSTEAMSTEIDRMRAHIAGLERGAQTSFDRTLQDVSIKLGVLAIAFVALVALVGVAIAKSISEPLGELRSDMSEIMGGHYERSVAGVGAPDEIGEMARAVEVFRETAIAKHEAEEEVRAAKDRAEATLEELRAMQTTLIETEKLAALGGLVAGVAHEVNNPVGISLTVASSLAARSEAFASEVASGQIRRSRLEDFTNVTKTAASQLVANLQRAAELIQSFKQVAVDRSQAERRSFDLKLAVEQIVASLRPSLKGSKTKLVLDIPPGIAMESFPGPLGQIITNLVLNAVHHAFPAGAEGTISIVARPSGQNQVRIVFRDDGEGMSEEVQRQAFDPFFTTKRGAGGTGLGLHIVYNLVTQRLGGRIVLSSAPGSGTSFLLALPLRVGEAPRRATPGSAAERAAPKVETAHVGA